MSAAEFSPSIASIHPLRGTQPPGPPGPMAGGRSHPSTRSPSPSFVHRRYGAIDFEYVIRGILLFHRSWQGREETEEAARQEWNGTVRPPPPPSTFASLVSEGDGGHEGAIRFSPPPPPPTTLPPLPPPTFAHTPLPSPPPPPSPGQVLDARLNIFSLCAIGSS